MTDLIQILLSSGFPGAVALVLSAWVAIRSFRTLWRGVVFVFRSVFPPISIYSALGISVVSVVVWAASARLSDALQYVEQRYLSPVYLSSYTPDDAALMEKYEAQIARHCTGNQFAIIRDSTRAIAARVGSTPLAIYETALLECGLKWWRVRDDKVAAGWIQFTDAGLSGSGITKAQVIRACESRTDEACSFVMGLTGWYLEKRARRMPPGANLANTIDLYLAVFAPAHIGKGPEAVVYAGFSNPAYSKNAGLDGWYTDSGSRIIRSRSRADGKITLYEIFLALQKKKTSAL